MALVRKEVMIEVKIGDTVKCPNGTIFRGSSKRLILMHDSRHFITLDVWRHFQLEKILN